MAKRLTKLRAAVRGSLLLGSIGALLAWLQREVVAIVRQLFAETEPNRAARGVAAGDQREFDALMQLIESSRLCQWLARPARWAACAWRASATHDVTRNVRDRMAALGTTRSIELAGVLLAAASVTDGVLGLFDPRPASSIRSWLWGALLVAAVVMWTAAPRLAVAWSRRFSR
jgi:hypothetical protein